MASTILSDNGVSSGSAGIKTTADSTGALALQTTTAGGAATTAVTIDTSQNVTLAGTLTTTGVTTVQAGTAALPAITTTGDTNTGIFFPSANVISVSTDGSERVRVDASGNVGIGTNTPITYTTGTVIAVNSSGAETIPLALVNSNGAANTQVSLAFTPNTNVPLAKISAIRTSAGGLTAMTFGTFSGSAVTEAMRITDAGLVGIGTSSPGYKLDVQSSASSGAPLLANFQAAGGDVQVYIQNGTVKTQINADATNSASIIGSYSNHPLVFRTNNTERARISTGGVVLIGATAASAAETLKVTGAALDRVVHFENTNNTSGAQVIRTVMGVNASNTSSYHMVCTANGDKLYIYGNGNVVNVSNSYGALSDIKLKENIVDATPKLADLMQVKVRNYNLIGDTTKQIGVVAQELETVFPAMIDESPDIDGEGGNLSTVTKSVKYSVFVPILIKAIQEQQALITSLTARIETLENKT